MTTNKKEIFNITIRRTNYNRNIHRPQNAVRGCMIYTVKGQDALMAKIAELDNDENVQIIHIFDGTGKTIAM